MNILQQIQSQFKMEGIEESSSAVSSSSEK